MPSLGDRVRNAREAKGWTQKDLALRADISQQSVADVEAGRIERPRRLPEIARALGVDPDYLLGVSSPGRRGDNTIAAAPTVRVVGSIASGTWRETDVLRDIETGSGGLSGATSYVPTVAKEPFALMRQYSLQVSDASAEAIALEGEYLICVRYRDARRVMADGDIVHIQRNKFGLIEDTVRRIRVSGSRVMLETLARGGDPAKSAFALTSDSKQADDPSVAVSVCGLVIGKYAPLA